MKARVIKAQPSDMELLNKITIASKMYWNYPEEWIEHWMDELTLMEEDFQNQHIYKVVSRGVAFGFCAIKENELNYEIMHLWIRPEYIGQGFGKYLLDQAIHRTVKKKKDIVVESDPNAASFYASQGFITFDWVESYPEGRFLPKMKRAASTMQ